MHTTNYYGTFIRVAEDCPVTAAEIPPKKASGETIASRQFDMLNAHPYKYTSDDVVFEGYVIKNNPTRQHLAAEREKFFSKGQPCLRSSALAKRYGWGFHFDAEGKVALYGVDSPEYKKYAKDGSLKQVQAMRSKR